MKKNKKVALVLGGGATLGFAHIGVIKILEQHNVPIDMIVGTSMGGLVGAAYASGLSLETMTNFACKFKKINFVDFNFNSSGLFSGDGVMRNINKFLPDKKIEEIDIPFACVACDLFSEEEVDIMDGNLRDAVRATISMPGILVPFKKDNKLLVDGGIVNNLPEDVAVKMGADIIISVDVLSNCKLKSKPKNLFDSIIYSMNIMAKKVQEPKSIHSDVLIKPDLPKITQMSFGKDSALYAIKQGELACEAHINEILNLIK